MNVDVKMTGVQQLTRRVQQMEEYARTNKLVRKGISEAAGHLAKAMRQMAPVRKKRIQLRKLDALMRKNPRRKGFVGLHQSNLAKATKRASVDQRKFRKLKKGQQGPRDLIPPGLLKRSIHSRVVTGRGKEGFLVAKAGMNVGQKKAGGRFAPHAVIVGASKQQERFTKTRASRGVMLRNEFIADATRMAAPAALRLLNARVEQDLAAAAEGRLLATAGGGS